MTKEILKKQFRVGNQYSTADSIMESAGFKADRTVYEVIKRSASFVTMKVVKGYHFASVYRRKVCISESGAEYITSFETGLVRSVDAKSENVSAEVEMIDCIDDYFVNTDAAAEVEITNASKANVVYTVRRFGKYGDSSCYSYNNFETAMQGAKSAIADGSFVAVQIIEGLNYSKPCFEWNIDDESNSEIDAADYAVTPAAFEIALNAEIANAEAVKNLVEEIGDLTDRNFDIQERIIKLAELTTPAAKNKNEPTITDKAARYDEIKAKVEEQRKNRKSHIDWEGTFADMELEKQVEDERKKLASIKAELKDRQQVLKEAIKNAVGNEDIYWKYAEKAKKQVSGWLEMYRDCVKNLSNYRTKLAA